MSPYLIIFERRTLDRHEGVYRERLGVFWHAAAESASDKCGARWKIDQLRNFPNEANAVLVGLAQPEDAARANTDPRIPDSGNGVEAVVV